MKNLFKKIFKSFKTYFNLIFKISIIGIFIFLITFVTLMVLSRLSTKNIYDKYSNDIFLIGREDDSMKLELKIIDNWKFGDYFNFDDWFLISGKWTMTESCSHYDKYKDIPSGSRIEFIFMDENNFPMDNYIVDVDVVNQNDTEDILFVFKRRFSINSFDKYKSVSYRNVPN